MEPRQFARQQIHAEEQIQEGDHGPAAGTEQFGGDVLPDRHRQREHQVPLVPQQPVKPLHVDKETGGQHKDQRQHHGPGQQALRPVQRRGQVRHRLQQTAQQTAQQAEPQHPEADGYQCAGSGLVFVF